MRVKASVRRWTVGTRRPPSLLLPLSILLLLPDTAKAYIDPGTGSYVVQLMLAGLLGALFALKVFWRRVLGFFRGLFERSSKA